MATRARKTQSTEVAVIDADEGALVGWEEKFAADAQAAVDQEASVSTGSMINTKGGVMTYMGQDVANNNMDVVVIDSVLEHNYYGDQAYDPDTPSVPVCFAFGRDDKTMVPHEECAERQAEDCKGCHWLKWNTAVDRQTGKQRKGKACQQRRKLMMIPADVLKGGPEAIAKAEIAFYKTPVTGVRNWATYVKTLAATFKRPPYAFVTNFSCGPDKENTFWIKFQPVAPIRNPDIIQAIVDKAQSHIEELTRPYQQREEAQEAPAPAARARGPRAAKQAAATTPAKGRRF